jgi:DNA gyrase subunit A
VAVRDFNLPGHFLMKATRKGLVKKTPLEEYSRPKRGGIIAIKLREDDELVDVVVTKPGDEVLLATASGMAIRFQESDARPMGRNTSGVKGITLQADDELVGMVVADPSATLLTACENGFGKRTPFGVGSLSDDDTEEDNASAARYRTQHRGGKGLRDIKTTTRNGRVIGIARVYDDDEVLMMTARGKIQRVAVAEISVIGRNTQGVRIMTLDDEDVLAAVVRVPQEEVNDEDVAEAITPPVARPDVRPGDTTTIEPPEADEEVEDAFPLSEDLDEDGEADDAAEPGDGP